MWEKYELTKNDARSADLIADAICRIYFPLDSEKAGMIGRMFSGDARIYKFMLNEQDFIYPVRRIKDKSWYGKLLNAKMFNSFWKEMELDVYARTEMKLIEQLRPKQLLTSQITSGMVTAESMKEELN